MSVVPRSKKQELISQECRGLRRVLWACDACDGCDGRDVCDEYDAFDACDACDGYDGCDGCNACDGLYAMDTMYAGVR